MVDWKSEGTGKTGSADYRCGTLTRLRRTLISSDAPVKTKNFAYGGWRGQLVFSSKIERKVSSTLPLGGLPTAFCWGAWDDNYKKTTRGASYSVKTETTIDGQALNVTHLFQENT